MNAETAAANSELLICFAVKEEAAPFLKTEISGRVQVLITGMGQRNAARALESHLAKSKPGIVLTCGFAGALNPNLAVGDVIFSSAEDFPFRPHLISSGATPRCVSLCPARGHYCEGESGFASSDRLRCG